MAMMISTGMIGFVLRFGMSMMVVACSSSILIDSARTGRETGKDFVVPRTKQKNVVQLSPMLQVDEISYVVKTTTTTPLDPAVPDPISNRPAAAIAGHDWGVYTAAATAAAHMTQIRSKLGSRKSRTVLCISETKSSVSESAPLHATKTREEEEDDEEDGQQDVGDDHEESSLGDSSWSGHGESHGCHVQNQDHEEEEDHDDGDKKQQQRVQRFLRFSDYIDPRDHPPQEPPGLIDP